MAKYRERERGREREKERGENCEGKRSLRITDFLLNFSPSLFEGKLRKREVRRKKSNGLKGETNKR